MAAAERDVEFDRKGLRRRPLPQALLCMDLSDQTRLLHRIGLPRLDAAMQGRMRRYQHLVDARAVDIEYFEAPQAMAERLADAM